MVMAPKTKKTQLKKKKKNEDVAKSAASPKVKTSPHIRPKVSPKLGAKASPKIGAKGSPKVSPKLGATASPKLGAKASPKLEAKASPKLGAKGSPKISATAPPQSASKKLSMSKRELQERDKDRKRKTAQAVVITKERIKKEAIELIKASCGRDLGKQPCVPDNWNLKFAPVLGKYANFVKSLSDIFDFDVRKDGFAVKLKPGMSPKSSPKASPKRSPALSPKLAAVEQLPDVCSHSTHVSRKLRKNAKIIASGKKLPR